MPRRRNALQKRLIAWRDRNEYTNREAAKAFAVTYRRWISWIYGESPVPAIAIALLDCLEHAKR